jgi:hypothetical protein
LAQSGNADPELFGGLSTCILSHTRTVFPIARRKSSEKIFRQPLIHLFQRS